MRRCAMMRNSSTSIENDLINSFGAARRTRAKARSCSTISIARASMVFAGSTRAAISTCRLVLTRTINYASDFREYAKVFKRWKFSNQDIETLEIEPEDFVYADPPYDVEFTTYSAGGFSWDDQVRTAQSCWRNIVGQ